MVPFDCSVHILERGSASPNKEHAATVVVVVELAVAVVVVVFVEVVDVRVVVLVLVTEVVVVLVFVTVVVVVLVFVNVVVVLVVVVAVAVVVVVLVTVLVVVFSFGNGHTNTGWSTYTSQTWESPHPLPPICILQKKTSPVSGFWTYALLQGPLFPGIAVLWCRHTLNHALLSSSGECT